MGQCRATPNDRQANFGVLAVRVLRIWDDRRVSEILEWSTWREALRVVLYRPHLRKTLLITFVVGTVLFAINQLDVVLSGDATTMTWVKAGVTYVVPFCVSNAGVLVASRVSEEDVSR
jgi:hypothetical protein